MSHAPAARSRTILKGALAVAALALSASALGQSAIGPRPLPPPTYGAPTTPPLLGYESSTFAGHGFSFTFDVDLAQVQKFLPEGYTPLASTTDPTRATVTAILSLQSLLTVNVPAGSFAAGTYGPYDTLGLVTVAHAPSGFIEIVSLASLVDNSEIVDLQNARQGAGSIRLADIDVDLHEQYGQIGMKARIRDFDFGLRLTISASAPAEIATQIRTGGLALPVRAVNSLASPPTPNVRNVVLAMDDIGAASDATTPEVKGRVRLSAGKLDILAVHPATFFWNAETFSKLN